MKLLLDTCVLIDYFGRREPFFEACNALRVAEWFGEFELWASAKSFTDVFYVLSRHVPSKDIQRAFCASASFLHVVSIDGNDIARAAQEGWEDFEDCLIAQAARKIGADSDRHARRGRIHPVARSCHDACRRYGMVAPGAAPGVCEHDDNARDDRGGAGAGRWCRVIMTCI